MGRKSITARGIANKQRRMPAGTMWKEHMKKKFEAEISPIDNKEYICQKCKFKAKYKFLRCPSCDEVQK